MHVQKFDLNHILNKVSLIFINLVGFYNNVYFKSLSYTNVLFKFLTFMLLLTFKINFRYNIFQESQKQAKF
jgi:hypothetical protein